LHSLELQKRDEGMERKQMRVRKTWVMSCSRRAAAADFGWTDRTGAMVEDDVAADDVAADDDVAAADAVDSETISCP
jgi:hypothetical protein